jgi:hypothetical protein
MADADIQVPVTGTGDAGPKKVDTRTVGAGADEHRQVIVLGSPTTAADVAGVTAANGLAVDVTRFPTGAKVQLTDGTDDATISVAGARKPLDTHLIDAAGNVISSFGGAGGTSAADDADMTPGSTVATPIMGVTESSPTTVTDGDMGIIAIDSNRRVKVRVSASDLDIDHDAADSGQPVKIGGRSITTFPTAVANNDRTNGHFTTLGQQLVAAFDPGAQVWKSFNATTTQTGVNIWVPGGGKKIALTHLDVSAYGTTAARCILWFAATGTTAFVEGTHQPAFKGSFAPSSTVKPGALPPLPHPIYCVTADFCLKITTDAAMSVDVVAYGYEF